VEAYTKKCQQTPFTTCENGSENISSILERLAFSSQNSTITQIFRIICVHIFKIGL